MTSRGVPADDLGRAAFVHQLIASGLFAQPSDDLEKLLWRTGTGLRDAVAVAQA